MFHSQLRCVELGLFWHMFLAVPIDCILKFPQSGQGCLHGLARQPFSAAVLQSFVEILCHTGQYSIDVQDRRQAVKARVFNETVYIEPVDLP